MKRTNKHDLVLKNDLIKNKNKFKQKLTPSNNQHNNESSF